MANQILISTEDTVLAFIDCQIELISNLRPSDVQTLKDKWSALAEFAVERNVPVLATVLDDSKNDLKRHASPTLPFSDANSVTRGVLNPWEDEKLTQAIASTERHRLVLAGGYTEGAVTFAALSALREGYDAYIVCDASFGKTVTDHETAVTRMIQAGVVPVTYHQLILEWGRNEHLSRKEVSKL